MRVLFAGALGEVGSSVARALQGLGYEVVEVSSRAPIDGRSDVIGIEEAVSRVAVGDVGATVNASGPGDRRSDRHQGDVASDEIASVASRTRIPAILLSTTRVLEGHERPPEEDAAPLPLTSYATANARHEAQWLAHSNTRILRLVNFFGVPQGADSPQTELLPWSLLTEGWQTGQITVRSGKGAVKDFVGATDVAGALDILLQNEAGPSVVPTVPGVRFSMRDLAHASSDAIAATGGHAPGLCFGQDDGTVPAPTSGWLASQGWTCRLTLREMTEAMTRWLIEWGDHIPRIGTTRKVR